MKIISNFLSFFLSVAARRAPISAEITRNIIEAITRNFEHSSALVASNSVSINWIQDLSELRTSIILIVYQSLRWRLEQQLVPADRNLAVQLLVESSTLLLSLIQNGLLITNEHGKTPGYFIRLHIENYATCTFLLIF